MDGNRLHRNRVLHGLPLSLAAAVFGALFVAACSDGAGRMLTSPSPATSADSAAHSGNVQLPTPVVVDAGVCEQLTLSWGNPGASGHLAQTWHLEIWEIVGGVRVDPKIYNEASYSTTSYTLALAPGTYEVRITAKSNASGVQNSRSGSYFFTVLPCASGCTLSQGYWKTHTEDWPVDGLTLGSNYYTASQLSSILNQAVAGNGLISLAHQLIAAKLNIANGANGSDVAGDIADADALIGGLFVPPVGSDSVHPSTTSALTSVLDAFNNGLIGPGHCE